MREKRGITLIALVVTIVVLLILAGVSINMLRGENGLIKKASDSKLETRAGNIEEEVQLWKNNNKMIKKQNEVTGANQALVSKEDMLKKLTDEKIAYENEINRNNETITVKRNDGTIVRVIKYNDVKINISKSPETEKAGTVVLYVDSVEGIPEKYTEEEIQNTISNMGENEMKERIKEFYIYAVNGKTFDDVLVALDNISEDEFWNQVKEDAGSIEGFLKGLILEIYENDKINKYITINPEGEYSSIYCATENGTYEFTVEDILTGNRYTEKVEVTNIDKSLPQFVVGSYLDSGYWTQAVLYNVNEKKYTTFEKAYILIDGKKVDISDRIEYVNVEELSDKNQYMVDNFCKANSKWIGEVFRQEEEFFAYSKFWDKKQIIILVKDNIEYNGTIIMHKGNE